MVDLDLDYGMESNNNRTDDLYYADYGGENEDYYKEHNDKATASTGKGRAVSHTESASTADERTSQKSRAFPSGEEKKRPPKERYEVESDYQEGDDQMFINEISNMNYA
jgi:hypothetical protein